MANESEAEVDAGYVAKEWGAAKRALKVRLVYPVPMMPGSLNAHMQPWEAQGSRHDLPRVTGTPDDSMRFLLRSWERDRPEQRASKKAHAKRKAKKGWA